MHCNDTWFINLSLFFWHVCAYATKNSSNGKLSLFNPNNQLMTHNSLVKSKGFAVKSIRIYLSIRRVVLLFKPSDQYHPLALEMQEIQTRAFTIQQPSHKKLPSTSSNQY